MIFHHQPMNTHQKNPWRFSFVLDFVLLIVVLPKFS
jgi:hypothetical protein